MNTLQESWSFHDEQQVWNGLNGAIRSPSNSSMAESDGSSESDSDLLSLFEQPVTSYSMRTERFDRGGRPFPYTRSKTRWRKRPNDEIKYLRSQLIELERTKAAIINPDSKLTKLKARVDKRTEAIRILRDEKHDEKLNAALVENRKLRAMVAGRSQVAKALQDAIDEHMRIRAQKVYCSDDAVAPTELIFV